MHVDVRRLSFASSVFFVCASLTWAKAKSKIEFIFPPFCQTSFIGWVCARAEEKNVVDMIRSMRSATKRLAMLALFLCHSRQHIRRLFPPTFYSASHTNILFVVPFRSSVHPFITALALILVRCAVECIFHRRARTQLPRFAIFIRRCDTRVTNESILSSSMQRNERKSTFISE